FKVVSDSIKAATGKKAEFRVMSGATDMRYFMWKGVPSLGYSASGGEKWHGDNEYVRVDSLVSTARVFELVMRNLE
ncbi:MAG: M20/M25/M40 family metallo-hydrolase, partial [Candidatus Omnitrophota bacterium]